MKPRLWSVPATVAVVFLVATAAARADDFYKGKTITFVVGFSAGGGFDAYTRLIARHFGKHIPGNPTVVVENRTGAGSLIAANYIYNQAPHDGTVIGNWTGTLILQQVLGNKAAKFDGRKFGFLGAPTPDSFVCALTKASGIKTMGDWFKSKRPVKIGGTAPGDNTSDVPRLVQAALGFPMKLVEGYRGTSKIRLAAESGEIDGGCWAWQSIKVTWAKGLESGEVHVVLQATEKSSPDLKNVPLATQYAKNDEARALLDIVNGPYSKGSRPYTVPAGVPQERLRLLQKAFMETLRDPDLLKEANKSQLEIDPVDGATIAKLMAGLYLTLRGSPIMYYGEEIGMTNNAPTRKEDVKDPIGKLGWPENKGRDGERTPMQWNDSSNAGFSTTTPWLPVPPSYKTHDVSAEEKNPDSILEFYQHVLALRHKNSAFIDGKYVPLNPDDANVLSYLRQSANETVLVVLNMTGVRQNISFDLSPQGISGKTAFTLLTTNDQAPKQVELDHIQLQPFEVYIGSVQ